MDVFILNSSSMSRTPPLELLIATGNAGKAAEFRAVLGDLRINFHTLTDFPAIQFAEETGLTYEENAVIKARSYAQQTGLWSLADDSGLEVDALGGAPGVFAARYAGEGASDRDRFAFLLVQLKLAPATNGTARFACVTVLADSNRSVATVQRGTSKGEIIDSPRGVYGSRY